MSCSSIQQNLTPARSAEGNLTYLQKAFWTTAAVFDPLVSFFFTQPLSDALALNTYTHGTKFSNYLNIRILGADPAQGGGLHGSTCATLDLENMSESARKALDGCRGQFHLFRDSSEVLEKEINYIYEGKVVEFKHGTLVQVEKGYYNKTYEGQNGELIIGDTIQAIPSYACEVGPDGRFEMIELPNKTSIRGYRPSYSEALGVRSLSPIRHAITSSLGHRLRLEKETPRLELIFYALAGLFTPTICVRVSPSDPLAAELKRDLEYRYLAVKTDKPIPPHYIGLFGIIHQGFNADLWKRIKASPVKVSIGVTRLAATAALIYAFYKQASKE